MQLVQSWDVTAAGRKCGSGAVIGGSTTVAHIAKHSHIDIRTLIDAHDFNTSSRRWRSVGEVSENSETEKVRV
jgi:hypothetical protein